VRALRADLHVHTALSPCAAEEMTPPAIVEAAVKVGLAMIAICDHNSAGNTAAVQEAAGRRLSVLAGMEITTAEEVHVLGLFPDAQHARCAAEEVGATLPEYASSGAEPDRQALMDAKGRTVGMETRMLAAASGLSLQQTVQLIRRHDGLAIASHVDRQAFGILGQLGFFPEDAGFDAVEVSCAGQKAGRRAEFEAFGYPVVFSSDSHFLSDIGSAFTVCEVRAPAFDEMALALKRTGGRRICHA